MTEIHQLKPPEHTIDVNDKFKIDVIGASENDIGIIKHGLQNDPGFWASVGAMTRRDPLIWRAREERKAIQELRVQVIKEGGRYVTKMLAIEGDAYLKKIAAEMKLIEAHDAYRLTLALSATFAQIYAAVSNVYRFVAIMEADSRRQLADASQITREVYDKFHKEFLLQFLSSTKHVMMALAQSPYAKYLDSEVTGAIESNRNSIGEFFLGK